MSYDFFFPVTLMLVHDLLRKCANETLNILFGSTQNKQQCGTKITCTEVRRKKIIIKEYIILSYGELKFD